MVSVLLCTQQTKKDIITIDKIKTGIKKKYPEVKQDKET